MNLDHPATEAAVTKAATLAQYTGGGTAVIFGLTPSEWSVLGVMGGILVALAGFFVNWYYKAAHLELAKQKAREWSPLSDE